MRKVLQEGTWIRLSQGELYKITGKPIGEGGGSIVYPCKKISYLDGKITAGMLEKKNERINRQVLGEIDYFKHFYNLQPKLYLSYERMAYFEKNDGSFRVTFDTDITTRRHDVRLELGSYGKKIIPENMFLMEIKINKAVPIWFTKILSEYDIYPVSFSKYGTEYKQYIMENLKRKDEFVCLNQFLQQQQTIQSVLAHQC